MSPHLSWLEAGVVGAVQGVAELFPVSSLGHSVLIPAWVGGSWARDLDVRAPESPYLAFIVGLHVATAIALLVYFWRDWMRIVTGLVTSITRREVRTTDQRLAWLLILGTIPVGLVGLLAEHWFRTTLARPDADGGVPGRQRPHPAGRRNAPGAVSATSSTSTSGSPGRTPTAASRPRRSSAPVAVGASQTLALAPGISRSGIATTAGLMFGLTREDAARFSFLLATPVILAAGALKLGDLAGPLGGRHSRPGAVRLRPVRASAHTCRYGSSPATLPTARCARSGRIAIAAGVASLVWFAVR